MNMQLSIGILSYNAPYTLQHTLETYKNSGLLNASDDIYCILQYSNKQQEEVNICNSFGIKSVCLTYNGRMGSGFKTIYENAKYKYILFLENDFCIKESNKRVVNFIEDAIYLIEQKNIDIVRGRNIYNAGEPNYALGLKNLPYDIMLNHEHLSETIYWIKDPAIEYSSKIEYIQAINNNNQWFKTNSYSCAYTNNPYICSKDFFKQHILPYCIDNSTIEIDISNYWRLNNFQCAFGDGVFTHERIFDGF